MPMMTNLFLESSKLTNLTKIRTISHYLKIEVGRHGRDRKPVEDRICHCGAVETEDHFIRWCGSYAHIRQRYGITSDDTLVTILEKNTAAEYTWELYNTRKSYI